MTRFLLAFAIVFSLTSFASAGRVFIGTSDTDPTAVGDVTILPGASTELYIWWTPDRDEVVNGAAMNIIAGTPGILDATASTVLNPTAGPFGPRYNGDPANGNVDPADAALLVEGMLGVSVNATGIDAAINDFGDFDQTEVDGNFLYGSLSVTGVGAGTTTVTPGPDPANPVTAEGLGAIDVQYGGLSVTVDIPEPATIGLAGLLVAGVIGLRRRG